jgi:glucokinase
LQGNRRPAIAEIGHLRPGVDATATGQTVESIASGWGIAQRVREAVRRAPASHAAREIEILCQGKLSELSTQQIAAAAEQGNELARQALDAAEQTLGWAIAQVVTLLAPNMVVVGGGVSLIGERFFCGLREQAATYVFPPLADAYTIVPAELGEEVVVQGALLLARGE